MRVKISYGVEVEKIPKKIQEIGSAGLIELQRAVESLKLALDEIPSSGSDYDLIIRSIQKTRASLTNVDSVLLDVTSILEGLNNYNKGEQDVPER